MSEKRFRANFDVSIYDSEKEEYISASGRGLEEIAKIMNEQQATNFGLRTENNYLIDVIEEYAKKYEEQQATIQSLEEEIKLLKPTNVEQYEQIVQLQEENEQLRKQVAEYELILRQHEFAEKEGFK